MRSQETYGVVAAPCPAVLCPPVNPFQRADCGKAAANVAHESLRFAEHQYAPGGQGRSDAVQDSFLIWPVEIDQGVAAEHKIVLLITVKSSDSAPAEGNHISDNG